MIESEAIIIGSAFRDHAIALTLNLHPEDFENEVHARIWVMMAEAANAARRISVAQVAQVFPELASYLQKAAAIAPSDHGDLPRHASAIRDAAARRRLKQIAAEISRAADDFEIQTEEIASQGIHEISLTLGAGRSRTKREVAASVVTALDKPNPCFATELPTLDSVWEGGLYSGRLYGIAARKKVGKTALLGTISHNLNRAGCKHLFIALEMSPEEIEQRNIARRHNFNSVRFLKRPVQGVIEPAADYATQVEDFTVYEHAPGASLEDVKRMVARAISYHKISGVILDYWQLVCGKGKGETEEYHLRSVAQWFADICRREKIWGLVAAQLNQEGNTRSGEGLRLACDMYMALHREKDSDGAWLEMQETRYTMYNDVGSESVPGLILNKHGPHFEDPMARIPRADFDGYVRD